MDAADNSKLEELMKKDITPEMQKEFFEIFKESQLLMPVTYSESVFEAIKDSKPGDVAEFENGIGFDINYLTDQNGAKAVPLFTSSEVMESAGLVSSSIAIFMSDLADMLKQTEGKYSVIAVNPFTEYDLNFPVNAFISLFEAAPGLDETLNTVLKILKEHSVELEEDIMLFLRSDENFMVEDAVDGVFVPEIPFNVSIRKDFKEDLKYLNILLMDKGKKILHIGGIADDEKYDTVLAPESEFHFVEKIDETTTVWKCGAQPFYDD